MRTISSKRQRNPVILIAGIVAALFCSAGIATIMDWAESSGKAPRERSGLIALWSGSDNIRNSASRRDPYHVVAAARPTARCASCGVVESILAVDTRDETTGVCAVGDWTDSGFRHDASVEAGSRYLATLAEIVAVAVSNASATNKQSAARYELTIRFRGGARSTIRLASQPGLKPGERVRIIDSQT